MSSIVSNVRTEDSMTDVYKQAEYSEEIVDDCCYTRDVDDDDEFAVF